MLTTVIRATHTAVLLILCCVATSCASRDVATDSTRAPVDEGVDSLMRRDLGTYFTKRDGPNSRVDFAYLRVGPTITGIAYPKYYLWITSKADNAVVSEGAARVALIDSTIEVTNFLSAAYIRREPASIDAVFPPSVATAIRKRLQLPDVPLARP